MIHGIGLGVKDEEFVHDYNICFMIVAMAIFGPYIIQYSSLMNSIHNKGFFKANKFNKFSFVGQIYLNISFTALGLLIMPIIDILLKIQAVVKVLSIPLCCKCCSKKKSVARQVQEESEYYLECMFSFNSFEFENFEKQKKYTQVLFEDTLMFSL